MKVSAIVFGLAVLVLVLAFGCTSLQGNPSGDNNSGNLIGGDKDAHGCLIAAGYSWCEGKQKCIRSWEENCPVVNACTMDALVCPDGSAVGRDGPECKFTPCPNCSCPQGYIQEGATCNPACYYSTPKCLAPSVECTLAGAGEGQLGGQTGIANPASTNCIQKGGKLSIISDNNGGQYGVCELSNGKTCEEWAYFRGECS